METVIFGCKTLENELLRAIDECGCAYEVKWVESGLHNVPKKLTSALQSALDSAPGCLRALMAFGYCGNALSGLRSEEKTLIIPRVDDCISLLLGSYSKKAALTKDNGTYFLTEGWLKGERNIWVEYLHAINKYGAELGSSIIDMMLEHHKTLGLLDTGCFDLSRIESEVRDIANTLKLNYKLIPATIEYLRRLLTGPWDNESFLVIPPHNMVMDSDLSSVM